MTSNTDDIYSSENPNLVDFAFDQRVVNVFPDMIRRSVPAYDTVIPLSALIAARSLVIAADASTTQAATPPSTTVPGVVWDLGCSRGATTAALLTYCGSNIKVIGVDNSAPMIEAARDSIAALTSSAAAQRVEWRCEDIQQTRISQASAVVMNYTLQFVPPEQRNSLLQSILAGLLPGAPLIYAEKVVLDNADQQAWADAIHLDFKRANGYSELEVAQKRSAIENIMIPDRVETHLQRLKDLGFERTSVWFSCLNWAAFIGYAPSATR